MKVEAQIEIAAPAETVFEIYQDVEHWNTWDPDTKSSSLDGPFQVGTVGRLVPTKGREVPMRLVEVTPNRSFTVQCDVPLFRMQFIHELTSTPGGTLVTQRILTAGALDFLIGRILAKQVREGFPKTLASLKRLSESKAFGRASAA
jgi:uncharacterized protein YndB with AHSA1/START domain